MHPSPHADLLLDHALLGDWPLPADESDDKYGRGTVLVIGGSERAPGAVLLAGTAGLRMGAGRLQIATAREVTTAIAVAMPEALVVPLDLTADGPVAELVAEADAIVVGPGMVDLDGASAALAMVLDRAPADAIVVVDAFAIAAMPKNRSSVARRRGHVIATPNREELDLLLDDAPHRGQAERAVADTYGVAVVSFGRVVAPDGRSWIDPAEVSGLGTSGAGDVLAGAAGGAGARCHDAVQAACWATLCHRLAASRLAASFAPVGYLARQLADEVAAALAILATPLP